MFQMIDEAKSPEETKRIFWYRLGVFLAAGAAVAGLMYFVFTGSITT